MTYSNSQLISVDLRSRSKGKFFLNDTNYCTIICQLLQMYDLSVTRMAGTVALY